MSILYLSAAAAGGQTAPSGDNPFFRAWNTPFQTPPYSAIREEHFLPAFQRAIAERRAEVEKIAGDSAPPTFENTIAALDRAGRLLSKVQGVFGSLSNAETNERLEEIDRQVSPLLAAARDDINLNPRLFERVSAVWAKRNSLGLTPVQIRLVEETYKDFVRGGANLDEAGKKRLRAINEELSRLTVNFGNNLLRETNAYRLWIENQADLAGLPPNVVAAAADAARAAGQPGKWLFTLQAPSIWPFLSYAQNRELRRQILTAYLKRGDNGNQFDNNATAVRMAALRAEKARLLGYATHADFVLAENMAKTPQRVYDLLNQIWAPASRVARREAADLQAMINAEGGGFKLEGWDWRFYAEKVKKAQYDVDDNELRPYFVLDNVRQGAFDVAAKLYGLKFIERTDIPKYHPEVRTFEVQDRDGSHLGVFYADYHPRPGKRGGAWSSRIRGQYSEDGREVRPLVVNVCNFTRPAAGQPALLSPEEVETLFHEFGHALHSLLARVPYENLAGTPRDFVELPSQIMENWATEPEVLKTYARHYQTGAVIPDVLVDKLKKASKFNQGFATMEYLAASYLDMDWHTIGGAPPQSAAAFEEASMKKIGLMPEVGVRYRTPYFQHIFAGGYSAGYYSYIWSEVLDADAFQAFQEKGLFDQTTAAAFRRLLEQGGSKDAMELYKEFRGREPVVGPLLERRGLNCSRRPGRICARGQPVVRELCLPGRQSPLVALDETARRHHAHAVW
jgi:peptidyl-dipeptidase Dcp